MTSYKTKKEKKKAAAKPSLPTICLLWSISLLYIIVLSIAQQVYNKIQNTVQRRQEDLGDFLTLQNT